MSYRTEIDVDYNCPVASFTSVIEKFNAHIVDFITDGPAGGNPNFTLEFDDYNDALNFLKQHHYNEDVSYLSTLIQEGF